LRIAAPELLEGLAILLLLLPGPLGDDVVEGLDCVVTLPVTRLVRDGLIGVVEVVVGTETVAVAVGGIDPGDVTTGRKKKSLVCQNHERRRRHSLLIH
jgi:hypothetical protein